MQFTSTQKSFAAWAAVAALFVLVLWLLAPVLAPFVLAAVLAYALTPLVNRVDALARGRMPRVVAVVVVEVVFLLLLLGMALLVVPIFVKELPLMQAQLPLLLDRLGAGLQPWLAQWGIHVALDAGSLKAIVVKYLQTNADGAMGSLMASLKLGGSFAFAVIGNAILIPVVLFYFLMEWERLLARLRGLIPLRWRGASDQFMQEADSVLGQYLRGQLLVMGLMAIFYSVGLALFGLDLALPIGVFTGLAIFIPYVGFGVGLFFALVAGLLEFSATSGAGYALGMVVAVYGLGQLVESLFLTPRLVGERIGLHPLAVIFALLAFGQLFGFVGVLVALPVSAVLLVAMRRVRGVYMASRLFLG